MRVIAGICAAGSARRMGFDKLTRLFDGQTLLGRALDAAGPSSVVALPPPAHPYRAARQALAADHPIVEPDDDTLGASIAALARAASNSGADGLMVLLADMPDITAEHCADLQAAFEAHPDRVVRACTEEGDFGHPLIFPARLFDALSTLSTDRPSAILKSEDQICVAIGPAARSDMDTPSDWARFTA